jgi:hypothetical protein
VSLIGHIAICNCLQQSFRMVGGTLSLIDSGKIGRSSNSVRNPGKVNLSVEVMMMSPVKPA